MLNLVPQHFDRLPGWLCSVVAYAYALRSTASMGASTLQAMRREEVRDAFSHALAATKRTAGKIRKVILTKSRK
jgi:hypothetical protein